MGTNYIVPLDKEAFIAAAHELGWVDGRSAPTKWSPNGDYALVAPGGHYAHDIEQLLGQDPKTGKPKTYTMFTRWGGNWDVDQLFCELQRQYGGFSEHDQGFFTATAGSPQFLTIELPREGTL